MFPNPKTSGNPRYTYLAAYVYGLENNDGDHEAAQALVRDIFAGVPVFDTGGRGATQTFAAAYAEQGLERVTPSISLFAAFPVAEIVANTGANGTSEVAGAYLEGLWSAEAQRIVAAHHYRVANEAVAAELAASLADLRLVTVDEGFGGWYAVRDRHLADGAVLDQVFVNR